MRHSFLDRYARLDSPVHRIPAGIKLAASLVLVLAVVIVPLAQAWFFIACALSLLITAVLSRIPALFLISRVLLLEPFALGAALLTLVQPGGLTVFLGVMARSTLCLTTMVLLSNTTPFASLLEVLRSARVPALLITTLALMYRYLFVLIDEGERMHRARASRTFLRGRRRQWALRASIVARLGIRSMERSERIYAAMQARGWQ